MNNGAGPENLVQGLNDAGLARLPVPISSAGITGDGRADLVVAIWDISSSFFPTPGLLLVYACPLLQHIL